MEGKRFDQLARAMATSDSRRRVLGGFLAGALGGLRIRPSAADDSGTAIADASGGNHNHASAAEQAANGNGQDHDGNGDGGRDHDNANNRNDNKGAGGGPDSDCLCSSGSCCGGNETCCDQFDGSGDETPIGSTCCDASTSCACGDCVPFCERDVPFRSCECNCRPGSNTCTLSTEQDRPNTCCASDEECCRVGGTDDPRAVNVCCPSGTCSPGVGCSTP